MNVSCASWRWLRVVAVRCSVAELARVPLVTGPTKSDAGQRDLSIPAFLVPEVRAHLRELMARMGHASPKAALIYQHRNMDRDRAISDAISKRAEAELKKRSGTQRARGKKKGS